MADTWTLYLRNPDLTRGGQIDDYQKFEANPKFNDVGTWQLDMDPRASLAGLLAQPGYGIELVRNDVHTVFAGDVTNPVKSKSQDARTLTVAGKDDNWELHKRVAHPQPGASAPDSNKRYSPAYDARTGICSTVLRAYVDANLGPSAITTRRLSGLTLPADPAIGTSVSGQGRWQNLLELLQELALSGGDIGFRIQQVGLGLQFQVYQPEDKSGSVMFSEELGNLGDYSYGIEASEANYLYVGGQGEGALRTIHEGSDQAEVNRWGRIERFEDRRDTDAGSTLGQEVVKTLAETANKHTLEFKPIATQGLRYLDDYDLGDKALVLIEGEPVTEVIRQVTISLSGDGGTEITPALDSPGQSYILRLFQRLRDAERRIKDLERR